MVKKTEIIKIQDIRKAEYKKRKELRLCVWCKAPLEDGAKGTLCKDCAKKNKERSRENRDFYIKQGICPICKKERIYPPEKSCYNCRERANQKEMTEEEREHRRELARLRAANRIENGLCPECGKRPPEDGYKRCAICRGKQRLRRKTWEWSKKEAWKWNGVCVSCGSDDMQEGTNVCKRCYAIDCKNLEKGREVLKNKRIQEQIEKGVLIVDAPITYKKRKIKDPIIYKK